MKKSIGLILGLLVVVLFSIFNVPTVWAKSKVDIVFIIDRSGSMSGDIRDVKNNVNSFVDKLKSKGFDYQLGLISYETSPNRYPMTSDVETFKRNLDRINVSGSTENGLDAIMDAINNYVFELNSFKYFVLIGDETIHSRNGYSLSSVQQQLIRNDIVLTSVGIPGEVATQFNKLSSVTGGLQLYLGSGFAENLELIFEQIQQLPIVEVLEPTENQILSDFDSNFVPRVRVTDPDSDILHIEFFIDNATTPRDRRTISNTKTEQIVTFNPIDIGTLSEGQHQFLFRVNDGSDTVQDVVNIRVDKTAPTLKDVNFSSSERGVTISGIATDLTSGLHSTPYRYSVGTNRSAWTGNNTWSFSGLIPNTAYSAVFEARDRVGHISRSAKTIYTKAQVPQFSLNESRENMLTLRFTDQNPLLTEIQLLSGSQFVNEEGKLVSTPVWLKLTEKVLSVTELDPNNSYTFRARARNGEGVITGYSQNVSATTLAMPPNKPTASVEQRMITLQWPSVPNIDYYEIEVDGRVVQNGKTTTYIHAGLSPNTRHTYRVRVKNAGGYSEWSPMLTEYTLPDPPPVPNIADVLVSQTTIHVMWNTVAKATAYDIEVDGELIELGNTTKYIHTGLLPESEHTYRIRAKNSGGTSDWSASITEKTLPYPPEVPGNITAILTNHSVELHWDESDRAVAYEIEVDGLIVDNDDRTRYLHEGLEPLSGHTYRVRARNSGGRSSWSLPLDVTTHPDRPTKPTNIMTTSDESSISLTWYSVPNTDVYEVELDGERIAVVTNPSFVHTGLQAESLHSYRVRAKNVTGYSDWSQEAIMITLPIVDENSEAMSLTNMAAVVTNQAITLTWDTVAPNAQYEIEVDGQLQDIGEQTIYHHGGLSPEEFHIYKIRLKQEDKPGYWVAVLSLSTLPNPPDAPNAINAYPSDESITLTWERIEGATGYDLEINGEIISVGNNNSFEHIGLEAGTAHTYRVRAKNSTDFTAWSPSITPSTTMPVYTVNIQSGVAIDVSLLANHVQDFSELKFVITYETEKMQIVDLNTFTPVADTESGKLADSNLIAKVQPGKIEFSVEQNIVPGTSWSGELTTIRFLPLENGQTEISVKVE